MTMEYENLQHLGSEEKNQEIRKDSKLHRDLGILRTTFSNFSVDTGANVQALTSHGQSLQETITSLKAEVEDHRQELLAAHSLNLKVVSVWTAACRNRSRNLKQRLCPEHCPCLFYCKGFEKSCCPLNWLEHEGSC
ncbi:Hypothetical predicted protein [Marmota monax]|uniref:Uncharacterized protein n=1 Tax=Marmota monax TaxID=9995 RepID=A0A5E4B8D7_MARMO|nr:Hypothetical predicted protein [Marmota monax]